jgi:hypothetical protein
MKDYLKIRQKNKNKNKILTNAGFMTSRIPDRKKEL